MKWFFIAIMEDPLLACLDFLYNDQATMPPSHTPNSAANS